MKRIGTLAMAVVFLLAGSAWAGEIHDAAEKGDLAKVTALVENDPKLVNDKDEGDYTPLMRAIMGKHPQVCALLIEKGADLEVKNKFFLTALHMAAQDNLKEICELLIAKGAKVDIKSKRGMTPLHVAAKEAGPEICAFLIEKGANPKAADHNGTTTLMMAAINPNPEVLKLFLDQGVDINAVNDVGYSALSTATEWANYQNIKLLVEKGADPKLGAGSFTLTPLQFAADANDLAVVKLLVEKGVDVNAKNDGGFTALHAAADKSATDIIKYLAEKGADVNAQSKDGWAPIDVARGKETIELLKSLGAKDDPEKRAKVLGLQYQAEAKTNLGALFTAQVSCFGDNNKYGTTFKDLGWEPVGETRYALFLANDVIQPKIGGPCQLPEGTKTEVTATGFTIVAVGNIDDDATLDVWTMNDKMELKNVVNDVEK